MSEQKINWHEGFVSSLQLELEKYENILQYHPEFTLNNGSRRIDCLVEKTDGSPPIPSVIGNYFKKYNLFDYKGPDDTLNVSDYFKTLSYAYSLPDFYNSSGILSKTTVTFACHHYPRVLFKFLQDEQKKKKEQNVPGPIVNIQKGVYNILEERFPVYLLILPEIPEGNCFWLSILSQLQKEPSALLRQYRNYQDNEQYGNLLDIFLQIIFRNQKGGTDIMGDPYKTFWRLYKPQLDAELENATFRGISQGITQGISQGISQGEELSSIKHIQNLMSTMKLSATQAMDALLIPESDRSKLLAKL